MNIQNILETETQDVNLQINDCLNFNDLIKLFKEDAKKRQSDVNHIKDVSVIQIEKESIIYTFICVECTEFSGTYKLIHK